MTTTPDSFQFDDTLAITFKIDNRRYEGALWRQTLQLHFDPALEDMGVGFKLEQMDVIAVDVAWMDDYDDTHEPALALTSLYYAIEPDPAAHAEQYNSYDVLQAAIHVPEVLQGGVAMAEWIVEYMDENVYNQRSST